MGGLKPPKVVAELGGWKDTRTLEMCYQRPGQEQLREALKSRRRAVNQD